MKYGRDYVLSLARQGLMLLNREYRAALEADAQRWDINSDLGVSLHAMRQLGHWPGRAALNKEIASLRKRGDHPVAVRIAQLAEEILNHSTDHDVRSWADEILTLTGGSDVAPPRLPRQQETDKNGPKFADWPEDNK